MRSTSLCMKLATAQSCGCTKMAVYIALTVLAMHVVADFLLQGVMASMKQRIWWVNELLKLRQDADGKLPRVIWDVYKHDYIVALLAHSYLWSFCILIPIGIYMAALGTLIASTPTIIAFLFGNAIVHAIIDHLKANVGAICLVDDQIMHLGQLGITLFVLVF